MPGLLSRSLFFIFAAAVAAAASAPAMAQNDFPSGPVRIVVPIPAGASADTLPRIVAKELSKEWHQAVVIENRPGAAQNLGAEIVASASPDGYTLLATPQGPLTISQSFFKDLRFDPSAFVPIGIFARQPLVLIANPNLPAGSFKELIAFAKAHPGKLNFASPGIGSSPHFTGEMLQAEAGTKFTHVPYKGLGPAMVDLLAGRVDLMIDNLPNVIAHIRDGSVKPLAVLELDRIAALPDVRTAAETLPGFHVASWFAIVAPPETAPAIVEMALAKPCQDAAKGGGRRAIPEDVERAGADVTRRERQTHQGRGGSLASTDRRTASGSELTVVVPQAARAVWIIRLGSCRARATARR